MPKRPRKSSQATKCGANGVARAKKVLADLESRRRTRRGLASNGLLIAEGDSWFDYPRHDVLEELEEKHGYDVVESLVHRGDTVEQMAYEDGQLYKVAKRLLKEAKKLQDDDGNQLAPKAILLSGGGNDIAGTGFQLLLNHKQSGLPVLNDRVVRGLIDDRLDCAITSLISSLTYLCEYIFKARVPILIHGYAHPVPDGRGFLGGGWGLPGPWLEPGFRQKGYGASRENPRALAENTEVMKVLIDRFNAVLGRIARRPALRGHVRYVSVLDTLTNELQGGKYKRSWADELHPNESGFRKIAARFDEELQKLP